MGLIKVPFFFYNLCYDKAIKRLTIEEELSGIMNRKGIVYGLLSYFLWGILPIYWSSVTGVNAFEILANRIVWALIFMIIVLLALGKWGAFVKEFQEICSNRRKLLTVVAAGITILFNWGIFIWAVSEGRIVETSMGYYINPLVSILFGVIFLGERLDSWSKVAVIFAAIGVGVMIFSVGVFPWVSLSLALTFAFYGLIKKTLIVDTKTSILLETLVVLPLAVGYIIYLSYYGRSAWQTAPNTSLALLVGAGPITAIPLLLFTAAAKLLPLSFVGFLQYLSPTLSLIIGVFLYGESFTLNHLLSFGCIWAGLFVFTVNQVRHK